MAVTHQHIQQCPSKDREEEECLQVNMEIMMVDLQYLRIWLSSLFMWKEINSTAVLELKVVMCNLVSVTKRLFFFKESYKECEERWYRLNNAQTQSQWH